MQLQVESDLADPGAAQRSSPSKIVKPPQNANAKKMKKKKIKLFNEESWREILQFYTNSSEFKKFLPRKQLAQEANDRFQDTFLNPIEYHEVKGCYDDYNIGDLALVFQNPDHEGVANKPITFKMAEMVIDNVLSVMDEGVSKAQMKKERDSFLYAFLTLNDYKPPTKKKGAEKDKTKPSSKDEPQEAHKSPEVQLKSKKSNKPQSGKTKKEEEEEKEEERQIWSVEKVEQELAEQLAQQKKDNKDTKETKETKPQKSPLVTQRTKPIQPAGQTNSVSVRVATPQAQPNGSLIAEQKQESERLNSKSEADKLNSPKNQDPLKEQKAKFEGFLEFQRVQQLKLEKRLQSVERKLKLEIIIKKYEKRLQEKAKQKKRKEDELKYADEDFPDEIARIEDELDRIEDEEDQLKFKVSQFKGEINEILQFQHKLTSTQIDPVKELLKVDLSEAKVFQSIKKSLSQGRFFEKKMNDEVDYDWLCHNTPPRDFLTLVRFTVMTKLSRNGFLHCRQFVSATGLHIFVIIKSSKEVIARQACNMKVSKQLEMGFADLFSLEPVDEQFRPLRLKAYLRSYNKPEDEEVKSRLAEIYDGLGQKIMDLRPGEKVEDHCRGAYPTVCQWGDVELRAQSIKKQQELDELLKQITIRLSIDQSNEKVELLDDIPISREEWEAYFIYNEYLLCFAQRIFGLVEKGCKEVIESMAFLFKLIYRKALGDANEFWFDRNRTIWRDLTQNNKIIKSFWMRLDADPIPPYTSYFQPITEAGQAMWRKYEINEKGVRSEFINMEKIKITHAIVLKQVNVMRLIKEQLAFAYFPLHEQYQLKGESKDPFFLPLIENGFFYPKIETLGQQEVRKLINELKDEAESSDFDSESLLLETMFNYRVPWGMPVATMRDYFGEKIALYFLFLSYYSRWLWYMTVFGIITQGFMGGNSQSLRGGALLFFSIMIIIWSTLFIEFWKREQVKFSVQFGQQNFEQAEAERPAFKGTYVRSITNDELNEAFYSPFLRKMKQLISFSISFLIIMCVIGTVLAIFFLKNMLIEQGQPPLISQQLPAILNSVQIGVFNTIYQTLVNIFNIFENHKILTSFEDALVGKVFIFRFVNTFNSFLIIAFLEQYFGSLNLCDINGTTNCFGILENQMSVIFVSSVTKYISVVITPFVKAFIMDRLRQVDEKLIVHPFNMIDQNIERQLELLPYQTNEELDGTVNSYMELAVQFSYLTLFGLAFPVAYLLAFLSNITAIQVDKLQLSKFQRRPLPQGAASIGNWLVILELITFFGIFTNAGLIVYTSGIFTENKITIFVVLLLLFLVLKYCIRFLVPDVPESCVILNQRHQYVVDKVVKGFGSSEKQGKNSARLYNKIGGVAYQKVKEQPPQSSRP